MSTGPFAERNFRWYFAARSTAMLGATMTGVALAFAVLEVSDSPRALGTVLAANSIPMVTFLLLGGVVADRFGRARVVVVAGSVAGAAQWGIALLVLSGDAEIWQLAALAAVVGTCEAVILPAMASVVPQLVAREHLQRANVLLSMVRGTLAVIGPSTAAVLVVTVGPGWAIAIDATTSILAALLLIPVDLPAPARSDEPGAVLRDLRAGWGYFRRTEWLWVVVLAFLFLNMIHAGALSTLGPALAKEGEIGEGGWGLILSATAVGLLASTAVMLRVRMRRPMLYGMLGISVEGLALVAIGLELTLPLLLVMAVLTGVGVEIFSLGWNLAMQEHVPEDMLSRAYSYDSLGSFVAIPIGQLTFGPLGAVFGLGPVMVAGGVVYVAIGLLALLSRSVRTLDRLDAPSAVSTTSPSPPG